MTDVGIGGAPTRPRTMPTTAAERKQVPLASGLFDYFPDALIAIAHLSWKGNEQHNPGKPLHWDRSKSSDEADTMLRHFAERGRLDTDGERHSAKAAWRALAILQKEIEAELQAPAVQQPERAWTPWHGARDDGPGMPEEWVEIELRNGCHDVAKIKDVLWRHAKVPYGNAPWDVVRWRPAKEVK